MLLRYNLLYKALKYFFNKKLNEEIIQETFLVNRIDQIGAKIKETKDGVSRLSKKFNAYNKFKTCGYFLNYFPVKSEIFSNYLIIFSLIHQL